MSFYAGRVHASCARCLTARQPAATFSALPGSFPSTSYRPAPSISLFHTSAPSFESRKKRIARLKKKQNLEQRELKVRLLESSRPDPVLGYQRTPEGEARWEQSELAQLILEKEEVWGVKEDRRGNLVPVERKPRTTILEDADSAEDAARLGGPEHLNFGLTREDRELLFSHLPTVNAEDRILDSPHTSSIHAPQLSAMDEEFRELEHEEKQSAEMLSRILDLRNASGKGIQVENIRRIIQHFGKREGADAAKGVDTGSPEVQAAVLTYRIRNLVSHLSTARHDNSNRRAMTHLVHQRAQLLKYLKRKDPQRYDSILPRIGLEARAVEGEIVVPGKPRIVRM